MLDACEMDVRHAVELYFDSMESAGRTHAQHRAQAARSSQAASAPPYSEESDTSTQTAADDRYGNENAKNVPFFLLLTLPYALYCP